MWIRKITKRKTQFLIIMLLTMITTTILTACISFTLETGRYVEEYYNATNSPISYCIIGREDGAELIKQSEKASDIVEKIVEGNVRYVKEDFYCNNKKLANEGNFFYEIKDISNVGYRISICHGNDEIKPQDDSVWVSQVFAEAFEVNIGDEFRIGKTKTLRVSAIVNTAICSSGFIDAYPFYVNDKVIKEIGGEKCYSLFCFTDEGISQKEFQEVLPKEIIEAEYMILGKSILKNCLYILFSIFGGVGVVSSIVILVVSLIVFRYLVRATISKEYEMIGIYKALGRENREIKTTYLLAYMVAGCIGMLPGTIFARFLTIFLSQAVLGGNRDFEVTNITTFVGIGSILVMSIILMLNVWGELKIIHTISPIQAMNLQNITSSKEKVCKSLLPNASSSLEMAVNNIWKRRGMSALVILIFTVSLYVNLLSSEVSITLSNYSSDKNIWENLPNYDCVIKMKDDPNALEFVKNSKMVEDYVQVSYDSACTTMSLEGTNLSGEETNPMIYSDFKEERYEGVPFTEGRICLETGEIACSTQLLDVVNKKVGDYIEISNGDKREEFLITGSYSAMVQGGKSFYFQQEDFEKLGFSVEYKNILVFLKDDVSYEDFSKKFEKEVPKSHIYKEFNFIEREGETVKRIADPICILLICSFTMFSILNMVNLVHTQNKESRRKYGILKAMGFTTGYIIRETIANFTFLYVIAIVLTLVIDKYISPILFSLACGVKYIYRTWEIVVVNIVGIYIALIAIVFCMMLSVRKIKPVELMEE